MIETILSYSALVEIVVLSVLVWIDYKKDQLFNYY